VTLVSLFFLPVLVYIGLGAYALWETGLAKWTWWILPACCLVTWIVSLVWKPTKRDAVFPVMEELPQHTSRDQLAKAIVVQHQEAVESIESKDLLDPHFYLHAARHLGEDVSRIYHPDAKDPIGSLTVPEVLAAMRLAVDDLENWFIKTVPGSHLITIQTLNRGRQVSEWYDTASNTVWGASILLNPLNVLGLLTKKITSDAISNQLKTEVLSSIYTQYIDRVGFYLIEMNSGRLKGGAEQYRSAFPVQSSIGSAKATGAAVDQSLVPDNLTIAVVGQVKAGKSSLINAIIGERVATTDVLPETSEVTRYRFAVEESEIELQLLDTPGYADAGVTKAQLKQIQNAIRTADIVLFVVDGHVPSRGADVELLKELQSWYQSQPQLKNVPVICCLTHIDLLSPTMEWSPPYQWREPNGAKAQSIHDAVKYTRELLGTTVRDVIPVCTDVDGNRVSNVAEELVPVVMGSLPDAKAAAMLRAFHDRISTERWQRLFKQMKSSSSSILLSWIEHRFPVVGAIRSEWSEPNDR